jgi:hypothetical protein
VHAIGELDDDDGALSGGAHEPTNDGPRTPTELPEHDLHEFDTSTQVLAER